MRSTCFALAVAFMLVGLAGPSFARTPGYGFVCTCVGQLYKDTDWKGEQHNKRRDCGPFNSEVTYIVKAPIGTVQHFNHDECSWYMTNLDGNRCIHLVMYDEPAQDDWTGWACKPDNQ